MSLWELSAGGFKNDRGSFLMVFEVFLMVFGVFLMVFLMIFEGFCSFFPEV